MEIILNEAILNDVIAGCRQNDRQSQQRLHGLFFHYAMTVARAYSGNMHTTEEVVNDAFFKVFTKIHLFSPDLGVGFRPWFRRIVINTAIDRYRTEISRPHFQEFSNHNDSGEEMNLTEKMTFDQVMAMLDQLPPAYRTVFNMFVGEGMTHEEIAESLGISVGSSKSNLSRARQHVRRLLANEIAFNQ